jgi:hypothetical protein
MEWTSDLSCVAFGVQFCGDGEDIGVNLKNGAVVLLVFPLTIYNGRNLLDVIIGLVLPLQVANNQLLTR